MFRRFFSLSSMVLKELSPNDHPPFKSMRPLLDQTFVSRSAMQSQIAKLRSIYCAPELPSVCSADFLNSAIYFASIHSKRLSSEHLRLCTTRLKDLQPSVFLAVCEKLLKSNNWHTAEQLIDMAFGDSELEALLFKFEIFALSGNFAKMREIVSVMTARNLLPAELVRWTSVLMSAEMALPSSSSSKLPPLSQIGPRWMRRLMYLILKGRILSSLPPDAEKAVKAIEVLEPVFPKSASLLRLLYMRLGGSSSVANLHNVIQSSNITSRDLLYLALKMQPSKFSYALLLDSYSSITDGLIAKTAIECFGAEGDFIPFVSFCLEQHIPLPRPLLAKTFDAVAFESVPEKLIDLAHAQSVYFSPRFYDALLEKQLTSSPSSSFDYYKCFHLLKRCRSGRHSYIFLEKAIQHGEIEMAFIVFRTIFPTGSVDSFVSAHLPSFLAANEEVTGEIGGNFELFRHIFDYCCHRQLKISQKLCQRGLEMALIRADFSFATQLRSYMNNYNYCDSGEFLMRAVMSTWKNIYK